MSQHRKHLLSQKKPEMIVLKYHILSKVDRCDVSPSNSKTVLKGSQTYTAMMVVS